MDDIAVASNNKDNTIRINQLPVSAARWQHHRHLSNTRISDMFRNFYELKNQKTTIKSANTETREKNKHIFGTIRIIQFLDVH
jgi:hypothetical protein